MSTFNWFKSKSKYSLIINDHVIRYVELRKPSPYDVKGFDEIQVPQGVIQKGKIINPRQLEDLLKLVMKKWKLKGKSIHFDVPDPMVVLRKVDIPGKMTDENIRSYLYMEIGSSIHLPFDNPVFDYYLLSQEGNKTEILLFAVPEEMINQYIHLVREAGGKIVTVEVSSLSFFRLYQEMDLATEENIMFVQMNDDGVNVSVFNGQVPLFIREVAVNWNDNEWLDEMGEVAATNVDIDVRDDFRDIIVDIERMMNFYQFSLNEGEEKISKVVLTGNHPLIQSFYEQIQEILSVPVEPFFAKEIRNYQGVSIPNHYHVNIGLALKEVRSS